jgi:spermidine synthase
MPESDPQTGRLPHAALLTFASLGAYTLLTQVVLVRECFALFSGNELSVAVQLALWLCATAAGGLLGSTLKPDAARLLLPAIPVAGAWAVVAVRLLPVALPVPPGSELPVSWGALSLLLAQAPLNLAAGAAFPTACRFFAGQAESRAIGRLYALEALGAVFAGAYFTFLAAGTVRGIGLSLAASAVMAAIAARILWPDSIRHRISIAAGLVALTVLLTLAHPTELLDDAWWRARHPGSERVLTVETRYQRIDVGLRDGQHTVYSNGLPAFALEDVEESYSGYRSADLYLAFHPDPKAVLVIGAGEPGMLKRVLEHPVERVVYCLSDPAMLDVAARAGTGMFYADDPRLTVVKGDGLAHLRSATERFDVVILDLPAPVTAAANRYFTVQTFRTVRSRLRPGGILVFQLPSSGHYVAGEMQMLLASVHRALAAAFGRADVVAGDRMVFVGGLAGGMPSVNGLAERFASRGVPLAISSDRKLEEPGEKRAAFLALYETEFDEFRQRQQMAELRATPARVNDDARPVAYYLNLRRWARESGLGPRAADALFGALESCVAFLSRRWLPLAMAAAMLAPLLLLALTQGAGGRSSAPVRAALACAMLASGWAGMLGELAIMFMYQNVFGQMYHALGALMATYMLALAAGSVLSSSFSSTPRSRTLWLLGARCLMIGSCALALALAGAEVAPLFFAALFVYAFALGIEYPVLNKTYRDDEGGQRAIGVLHAMDHLGAAAGCVLGGTLMLPLLGPQAALAGVAGVHAVILSVLCARAARRGCDISPTRL